jgi:phosphoglycerate dehydrogenase-like enzyme
VWESGWAVGVPAPPLWPELAGKTLGILGYGHIGQAVARRARAFDMEVRAIRRNFGASADDRFARIEGIDGVGHLLRCSDFLVITLPLTPETRGLLGEREFAAMTPTAILVNVARGEILDEDALYAALAERRIAAAALDVWYLYPTSSEPTLPSRRAFHTLPNVLMTPHVADGTEGTVAARAKLIAENIQRIARGDSPLLTSRQVRRHFCCTRPRPLI